LGVWSCHWQLGSMALTSALYVLESLVGFSLEIPRLYTTMRY